MERRCGDRVWEGTEVRKIIIWKGGQCLEEGVEAEEKDKTRNKGEG
jgi:hypothetical protein